jgi:hypothetical protein
MTVPNSAISAAPAPERPNFLSILYAFLTVGAPTVIVSGDHVQSVMSFRALSVSQEELGSILADYLALDRARILRRLMVVRFGLLALGAGLLETVIHGFSVLARSLTIGLFLVPPVWAWVVELARERRVAAHRRALDAPPTV